MIVNANTDFGLRLLGQLTQDRPNDNIFVSPFSITQALTLAWNGAGGDTQQQIGATLGLGMASPDLVNHANAALLPWLRRLDTGTQLSIANALWINQGLRFAAPFQNLGATDYGAQAATLNFALSDSVRTINDWISTNTQGKITNLLSGRDLAQAQAVLTNAVYFHGQWQSSFSPSKTQTADFFQTDGSTESVPLMHQQGSQAYLETDQFQMVALPYGTGRISMDVILPKQGTDLNALVQSVTAATWQQWLTEMHPADLDLFLPRFHIQYKILLNAPLSRLGMAAAFGPSADFSPMGLGQSSFLSAVIHQTTLDVDEQGTTATGATAVVAGGFGGMPAKPIPFRADHPFFCAIRDSVTGTLLFAGVIVHPTQ